MLTFNLRSLFQTLRYILLIALVILLGSSGFASESDNKPIANMTHTEVVDSIHSLMLQHHYNAAELSNKDYQNSLAMMKEVAARNLKSSEFIEAINAIWKKGPFSHVVLSAYQAPAEQVAQYLDTMNVGDQASQLTWDEKIAILTINTMMGLDTIERIRQFYIEIAQQDATAIIIDLRNNEGGAFAIRPLVGHLITEPFDAGFFISNKWTSQNQELPGLDYLNKLSGWDGWSVRAFWQDVLEQSVIKVQFKPEAPHVDLPVYILTSKKTASAAELATEALKSSGRVIVIGEETAGEMLSQKPFDIGAEYQLYLPIADYYSLESGRLEGAPIRPDVPTSSNGAMARAKQLIEQSLSLP